MPELRKVVRTATDPELRKLAGLHGLRCAMIRNMPVEAEDFLQSLRREFPHVAGDNWLYCHFFRYAFFLVHGRRFGLLCASSQQPTDSEQPDQLQSRWCYPGS